MAPEGARRAAAGLPDLLIALLLGVLESTAFAPRDWSPVGILALAGLWWLWDRQAPRLAAWTGFAFGFGLFGAGTYWLYTAVHGFGKAPIPLALLLMVGLVAIMACDYAVLGWLYARVRRRRPLVDLLCLLPAGWVLMEWFRGWFLSGFPWLSVGYAQVDTPLAGYAPVLGIYGVSMATALAAGALLALAGPARRAGVATLLAVYALGFGLRQVSFVHPSGPAVTVAIVQGSISQDEKWQAENIVPTLNLYRSLTETAFGSRIIVWPEATLPQLYHEVVPYLSEVYTAAHAHNSDLVMGLLRYDVDADKIRNGLLALGDDEQWYYKRRLVPFGEFFPVPGFIRSWMRLRNLAYVDLAPGAEHQPPLSAGGLKLGETICYEDSYAAEQLAVLADADALVNVSNDAWYGDSSAPHQHLQITRMRAIEAGRYMMRATNNGVSAIIAPDGRVLVRSRQFVPEVIRGEVVPYAGLTPYARLRNYPVLLLCLLALAGALWSRRGIVTQS